MGNTRDTGHLRDIVTYDGSDNVTFPANVSLIAPAGSDNSTKVPSTAWVRTYVSGVASLSTSGTSGANGSSGSSGQSGAAGSSGSSGSTGTSGSAGTSGSSGSSGQSGAAGSSGSSGSTGTSGSAGTSGSSGSSGQSGAAGSSGSSGQSGAAGSSGSSGSSGQSGAAGSSGSSGQSGAAGSSGSSGSSGQSGAAGSSGSSGQSGAAGSSGSSGQSGAAGSSGSSGSSGQSGAAGSSGSSGQSGAAGSSGSSGQSGAAGSSGSSGQSGGAGSSGSSGSSGQTGGAGSSGTSGTSPSAPTTSTYLTVQDTRNTASTPQTNDASNGVRFDFKANSTNSLSDGGTYNGVMYFRKYGGNTDWSGGGAHEVGFSDGGNIWHRYGSSTTWGTWYKIWDTANLTNLNQLTNGPGYITSSNYNSYALPLSGGTMSGPIRRSGHSTTFFEGSYNNVGGNSAYSNPIYTIGSAYNPSDSSLGTMYGIGYAHPNFWGAGKTSSWGLYCANGGVINVTLGEGATSIWASNDIVAYSDIRVKDNIEVVTRAIEKIKAIRGVTFTRKDAALEDRDKRHAGVIAQEVLKVLPEVVTGTEKDMYSVAYGNMAALFIEAIKEQQTQIENQALEIRNLKALVGSLLGKNLK